MTFVPHGATGRGSLFPALVEMRLSHARHPHVALPSAWRTRHRSLQGQVGRGVLEKIHSQDAAIRTAAIDLVDSSRMVRHLLNVSLTAKSA